MSGKPCRIQLRTSWFMILTYHTAAQALSLQRIVLVVPIVSGGRVSYGMASGRVEGRAPLSLDVKAVS